QYLVSTLQSRRGTHAADAIPPDEGGGFPVAAEGIPVQPPSTRAILDGFSEMSYAETVMWIGQQLADGLAHAHERGVITRDLNPAVTPALESIVRRCLEPDPARRYQSARELQEDLKRQREHRPLRYAPETSLPERARKWGRRHPRVASLSSALTLAAALLI